MSINIIEKNNMSFVNPLTKKRVKVYTPSGDISPTLKKLAKEKPEVLKDTEIIMIEDKNGKKRFVNKFMIFKKDNTLKSNYKDLIEIAPYTYKKEESDEVENILYDGKKWVDSKAFRNLKIVKKLKNESGDETNLTYILQFYKQSMKEVLEKQLNEMDTIKFTIGVNISLKHDLPSFKESNITNQFKNDFYIYKPMIIMNKSQISNKLNEQISEILDMVEEYLNNGSDLSIVKVNDLFINMDKVTLKKGSSYIPLPTSIQQKNATINIKNDDEYCFLWSILAYLNPLDSKKYKVNEVKHYKDKINMVNISDIPFPVPICDDVYKTFENNNNIGINLLKLNEDNQFKVIYVTSLDKKPSECCNLLIIGEGENGHYVYIKNLSRLIGSDINKNQHSKNICLNCNHNFSTEEALNTHWFLCKSNDPKIIEMPKQNEKIKFEGKDNLLKDKKPFVIYADFESTLQKVQDDEDIKTKIIHNHLPNSYCLYLVSNYPNHFKPIELFYRGNNDEDVMKHFYKDLLDLRKVVSDILAKNEDMELSEQEQEDFINAETCYICNEELKNKCRDHDHFTGQYLGTSCNRCNLNRNYRTYKLPVIFHNLRGYDSHHIIKYFNEKKSNISCIANSSEKFMTFSINNFVFIDSFQFTMASLDELSKILINTGENFLTHTIQFLKENNLYQYKDILLRKGIYPYTWLDSFDKFEYKGLPTLDEYDYKSDKEYNEAVEVYKKLGFKTFGDYHDLYLRMDVYLLADVFENQRNLWMNSFGLDPIHRFTAPGISWMAMLKYTGIELGLISDYNMYMTIEKGIRGGISMIANRYSKANNKYMSNYDNSQKSKYIIYLDANNLYGWSMMQHLPVGNYHFENPSEWNQEKIMSIASDGSTGYIFVVDLEYPEELHDLHKDYPLAPERKNADILEYSEYMYNISSNSEKNEKLLCTLKNKYNYTVHYRNLQLYLRLGLKLSKISSVIAFDQSGWLGKYINFNTVKRSQTKNKCEQDLFKLCNNSVFGKTMEDVRKHLELLLLNDEKKIQKTFNSPYYKRSQVISDNLLSVQKEKKKIILNKPIAVGFSILELSKLLMYSYYYEHIKPLYGDKVKLLMTDTDSLVMEVETDDIYEDMYKNKNLYDFSEYFDINSKFYDESNKKIVGKFKDETNGNPILEFVGIRSKVYSFMVEKNNKVENSKKLKGVKKCVVKSSIHHDDYIECLKTQKELYATMENIVSKNHTIHTVSAIKSALKLFDNKRCYINNYESLPYGHYDLQKYQIQTEDKLKILKSQPKQVNSNIKYV